MPIASPSSGLRVLGGAEERFRFCHFQEFFDTRLTFLLNPLYTGSSTVICWTSTFVILGVSGRFCRFYFISNGISC